MAVDVFDPDDGSQDVRVGHHQGFRLAALLITNIIIIAGWLLEVGSIKPGCVLSKS